MVFDVIRPEAQNLIQDCSRHCTKAVASNGVAIEAKVPQRRIDRVLAHRGLRTSNPGKDELAPTGERPQVLKDLFRLGREGHDVRGSSLAGNKTLLCLFKIDILPVRLEMSQ